MTEQEPERDRQKQIVEVALKVVGVALAIGLFIGIGTWLVVKSLDLDSNDVTPISNGPVGPVQTLPTTALPQPTDTPDPEATDSVPEVSASATPVDGDLILSASPLSVGSMERINLTGQWAGRDAVGLVVQRFESGAWANFGVQLQVNVGTFDTYVLTGRAGENRFRVYDPQSKTASNEVTVTVE
ncbi:MAG: hypothetical protein JWQ74_42 [Marmoricola sp.]|nr:hypothetical protein [Marmoricola sp.]